MAIATGLEHNGRGQKLCPSGQERTFITTQRYSLTARMTTRDQIEAETETVRETDRNRQTDTQTDTRGEKQLPVNDQQ